VLLEKYQKDAIAADYKNARELLDHYLASAKFEIPTDDHQAEIINQKFRMAEDFYHGLIVESVNSSKSNPDNYLLALIEIIDLEPKESFIDLGFALEGLRWLITLLPAEQPLKKQVKDLYQRKHKEWADLNEHLGGRMKKDFVEIMAKKEQAKHLPKF